MTSKLDQHYYSRYPRSGRVAILCEGDVVGIEVDLLERWTASTIHVDVWPCGTKTALYGVSDAIGRARPILVIEDRDFRSAEQTAKYCEDRRKNREKRAVRVIEWRCWQRNEIENYLIEPSVLLPVLSDLFGQDEQEITSRLSDVIKALYVDQAASKALATLIDVLPDRGRAASGLPRKTARPVWRSDTPGIKTPERDCVRTELRKTIERAVKGFKRITEKAKPDEFIEAFNSDVERWKDLTVDSNEWRIDWAGKEILESLLLWLSGEFGWPAQPSYNPIRLNWENFTDDEHKQQMRTIMRHVTPRLVSSFLLHLAEAPEESPIVEEWESIRKLVVTAIESSRSGH